VKSIVIYTDGSSRGNPGPGGYGVILRYGDRIKEISGGFRLTTNNRMELLAVIVALEALKSDSYPVIIYSDSKYVVDAVEKRWLWTWEKKAFKNKKNEDLWRRFIPLYKKYKIQFKWLKGHSGVIENEKCDRLAVSAAEQKFLQDDPGYIPEIQNA
jgi:ribonuclease HI